MNFPGFKDLDTLDDKLAALLGQLDPATIPRHVAIIMDGNGRWAKKRNKTRLQGHHQGAKTAKEIVETAVRLGVSYLTLYSFSSENWSRPKDEVEGLMSLFSRQLSSQRALLMDNKLRFRVIGDLGRLDPRLRHKIEQLMDQTDVHSGMTVQLAINYGGRDELVRAVKRMALAQVNFNQLDETMFTNHLDTAGQPDPDLLIRTSGEYRLSNYLPYQLAYAEFYFTPILWPDFNAAEFVTALLDFQHRSRRYGAL